MCYGDSGGPTYIVKKSRKYGNFYRILKGVNSIMDDYCQQFMIASSVSSNLRWILENVQSQGDIDWLAELDRRRRKSIARKKTRKRAGKQSPISRS